MYKKLEACQHDALLQANIIRCTEWKTQGAIYHERAGWPDSFRHLAEQTDRNRWDS